MKKTSWMMMFALVALFSITAVTYAEQVQKVTVEISGMSYTPSEVVVTKGVPVRMELVRDDQPTCGGKILFPELGIEREVAAGESTVVEFTPKKSGELTFTCGMKMMKGTIIVQSN